MNFSSRMHTFVFYVALMLGASMPSVGLGQAAAEPLLQQSSLVYQGAFRLPQISCQSPTYGCFSYGGTALAYNPAHHSLYIVGHPYGQLTAEVSIPTLVNSSNLIDLNIAALLQPFTDALEGKRNAVNPTDSNTHPVAGQLVYGGRLIVAVESYYDGSGTQKTSHFARPLDLSVAVPFVGPTAVGSSYPGYVDGYMTTIPSEWQSQFGGPALTGNCCLNIISFQSNGPAVSVFDPTKIGISDPVPATLLVGYPHSAPLGTGWGTQSMLFNGTTMITGVVFPSGTRSVLFFGRQGVGPFCYGPGTSKSNLIGTPTDGGANLWCNDPASAAKGVHAFPYVYQVWAYDANDLLAVRNGSKQPDEVQPYATWSFTLPFENRDAMNKLGGVAYDAQDGVIFVSQECADSNCNPIIHAFKVTDASPPAPPNSVAVR